MNRSIKENFQSRDQQVKQIYLNKKKLLHKKMVQLPQDWFGIPTWPPFHCFREPA